MGYDATEVREIVMGIAILCFILGCGVTSIAYNLFNHNSENVLGQMICDEQYGEGKSVYINFEKDYEFKTIVVCKSTGTTEVFDNGKTKLIGGE